MNETKEKIPTSNRKKNVRILTKEDYKGFYNLNQLERNTIVEALCKCKGEQKMAASMIGISRETIYYKLIQHSITIENEKICLEIF